MLLLLSIAMETLLLSLALSFSTGTPGGGVGLLLELSLATETLLSGGFLTAEAVLLQTRLFFGDTLGFHLTSELLFALTLAVSLFLDSQLLLAASFLLTPLDE